MCAQIELISWHASNADIFEKANLIGASVKNQEVVVAVVVEVKGRKLRCIETSSPSLGQILTIGNNRDKISEIELKLCLNSKLTTNKHKDPALHVLKLRCF